MVTVSPDLGVARALPCTSWIFVTVSATTESAIAADAERACASETDTGRLFEPRSVPEATVALNENTLSPAVASPFVPLSKNDCAGEPPIELRSPLTAIPVLVGFVPGVTVTVSRVDEPAVVEDGVAAP